MPTTFVSGVRSLRTRLNYVSYGHGAEGTRNRRARKPVRALAFECDFGTREQMASYARHVREKFANRMYEGYEVRVSWSREELDPDNPEDVEKAMEFGHELARALLPNTPVAITAHGDGVGHCLHLHIDFVNVQDTERCRAIRGPERTNRAVAAVTTVLSQQRGMRVVRAAQHTGAWADRRAELESAIKDARANMEPGAGWTRSLRDNTVALRVGTLIDETITVEARNIGSIEDFERALEAHGVGIIRKPLKDGTEGWTYTAEVELEGKMRRRRCKASRILRDYSADKVMETIAQEAERQRQAEEAERAESEALAQAQRDAAEHKRRENRLRRAGTKPIADALTLEEITARYEARKSGKTTEEAMARERARKAEEARKKADRERALAKADDERRRQEALARAVTVVDNPAMGPVVTVNSALVGADDSPWQIRIAPDQVSVYAGTALSELPKDADVGLRRELTLWRDGQALDVSKGTPAQQVAHSLADAMQAGIEGRWPGREMPREKWSGFAVGFDMAMQQAGSSGRVSALQVVSGMFSMFCEQIEMVGTSLRDMARDVLQRVGVRRAEEREEKTRKRVPVDAQTSFGRANQAARNLDFTRDMLKAPERKQAEHGPAPEPEPIRDEPKPLSELDLTGLKNFGE